MSAWLFQKHTAKQKLGDSAPWSVGWYDPEGKKRSKKIGAKSVAEKFARKVEGQLAAGTYEGNTRASWEDFHAEYKAKALDVMEPNTRATVEGAIEHFVRIVKPARMRSITAATFDDYTAVRRLEPKYPRRERKKGEPLVRPATINKELRALRAMIRKAARWKFIPAAPSIEFLKEEGKLPTYVTPEDFAAIYKACSVARWPADMPYAAADWWRALLVMAYMTGWRIGSLLSLRREHVDLEAATAISLAKHNKGRRDQKIPLHPMVVEHLRKLASFSPVMFPWLNGRRCLWEEFHAIQKAAKVKPEGKAFYGFHDLRRAFATMNAANLTADALQALMQHKDY